MDQKKIYRVKDALYAVFCRSNYGPSFGGEALGLYGNPLNKEDAGFCHTNGSKNGLIYGIKSDIQDNHEITGEGHKQKDDSKRFTCVEIEVYGVIF